MINHGIYGIVTNLELYDFKGIQKEFEHNVELWPGVFTQNNAEITENTEIEILEQSWLFLVGAI